MGRILVVACLCLVWSSTAFADQGLFIHVVRPGETLASIAQRYYGDATLENILVAQNGLSEGGGAAIVVGLALSIPYSFYHRVKSGDTWQKLAEAYYGDDKRAHALIAANNASTDTQPEQKAQLLIPFALRYVVDQKPDLTRVSEIFYGSKQYASALRRFNSLSRNRLKRGQLVLVPLPKLLLSEQGRAAVQQQTGQAVASGAIREEQQRIEQQIPKLREHVRRGQYLEALAQGSQLVGTAALTANQIVAVQRELAAVYIAMNREDLAVAAFKNALQYRPDLELDTAQTSPRILEALDKAKKASR